MDAITEARAEDFFTPLEERFRLAGGPQRSPGHKCPDGWSLIPCAECGKPMELNAENDRTEREHVYTPRQSDKDSRFYIPVFDGWECTETFPSSGPGCWNKHHGLVPKYGTVRGKDKQANGRSHDHEAYHRQDRGPHG
jgi:hypothetical protein